MKTDELREKYLAFFETKGHARRPSDVLVPPWDPSVLFTPAGMNQFKDHFLGRCKLEFTRATTCQKCLRTGDIDNVGRTAYHHTFFEMLGNFSFGDYFKREAIHWAWEFLTGKKWLGLDPDAALGHGLPRRRRGGRHLARTRSSCRPNRIERLGEDENFWPANAPSQGPDGVCGPCSEIYLSRRLRRVGRDLEPGVHAVQPRGRSAQQPAAAAQQEHRHGHGPGADGRGAAGRATELPHRHPAPAGRGGRPRSAACKYDPQTENGRRLRRIADHVRACTFAVHENVYPGAKARNTSSAGCCAAPCSTATRWACDEPFLHKLVPVVAEMMTTPYPELRETVERVAQVIEQEEQLLRHDRRRPGPHRADLRDDGQGATRHGRRHRRGRAVSDLRLPAGTVRDAGRRAQLDLRLGRLPQGDGEARPRLGETANRAVHDGTDRGAQEGPAPHAVPRLRNGNSAEPR